MSDVRCRKCNANCGHAPSDMQEFEGLCADCVIRQEVFPLVTDPRIRELMEYMLNDKPPEITAIEIVMPGNNPDPEEMLRRIMHLLVNDGEMRHRLVDLLEMIDKKTHSTKDPVTRNDPRTG